MTSFGVKAKATGELSVAFGPLANASNFDSVAFGAFAESSGLKACAIGPMTIASGDRSVAFGSEAQAKGDSACAFGARAEARADGSIVLGANAINEIPKSCLIAAPNGIRPDSFGTCDLGSKSNPFRDIYLTGQVLRPNHHWLFVNESGFECSGVFLKDQDQDNKYRFIGEEPMSFLMNCYRINKLFKNKISIGVPKKTTRRFDVHPQDFIILISKSFFEFSLF